MMERINHKIKKGSLFNILNAGNAIMDTNFFLLVFVTAGKKKISNDISRFASDNMDIYGRYALINDHIDLMLSGLVGKQPALMQINADGVKRWKDAESEKQFWRGITNLSISRRTNRKAVIIESSKPDIPFKIIQNADFIFIPKEMRLSETWKKIQRLIKY